MATRPETVTIAITCANGMLSVMGFITCEYSAGGRVNWARAASPEAIDAEIKKAFQCAPEKLPVKSWRVIDEKDLPQDRSYRAAWRDDGKAIYHDMAHARELHREQLRRDRAEAMPTLDVEYIKADESGDAKAKAAVVARKQVLRDITKHPGIEAAQTVEELKAVTLQG